MTAPNASAKVAGTTPCQAIVPTASAQSSEGESIGRNAAHGHQGRYGQRPPQHQNHQAGARPLQLQRHAMQCGSAHSQGSTTSVASSGRHERGGLAGPVQRLTAAACARAATAKIAKATAIRQTSSSIAFPGAVLLRGGVYPRAGWASGRLSPRKISRTSCARSLGSFSSRSMRSFSLPASLMCLFF